MPVQLRYCLILYCLIFAQQQNLSAQQGILTNNRYTLTVNADQSVSIKSGAMPLQTLQPSFTILFSDKDPQYARNHQNYYLAPRTSARWAGYEEDLCSLNNYLSSPEMQATLQSQANVSTEKNGGRKWIYKDKSGKILHTVTGAYASGTTDPFVAGKSIILTATGSKISGRTLQWQFAAQDGFTFYAALTLPDGEADLEITYSLKAQRSGYYSAAFTGAPKIPEADMITIPQETAGRQLRQFNHLVPEAYLRLPRVQITTKEWSSALVVDSKEMPFRISTMENSRFGMMLRRKDGYYDPVAFYPVMGGAESRIKAGDSLKFTVHYLLRTGDWKETYQYIARTFYDFRDQRDNSGAGSLNATLERTIDYLIDRNGHNYAMWHAEQKYYDYWTDNSGIFKPFSPLFGLSAAVVTDDEELYIKRALPQVEFALSRANNTFAPYEVAQNGQVKARNRTLGESYMPAAQLVSMQKIFQGRTPAIAAMAERKEFSDASFADLLARYNLTGNPTDLNNAKNKADIRLKKGMLTGAEEEYMNFLDLYEATGIKLYLNAAKEGAYGLTTGINLSPAVPAGTITLDSNGHAPVHEHSFGRHKLWGFPAPKPYPIKQQTVPAWRAALTGLTSPAYRGEYWMNNHGQLMRIAALTKDDFLRDVARWGMVGRFGNYAGDNRSKPSLVAELPDAVEHPIWQLDFATVNPGHAWEFAGEIIDFLVSDAFQRSDGAIDFPAQSMQGSSFRVKTYGDRPGRFYEDENVQLWLPRKLITSNNKQIDYLAGYGNGNLYLAFWNQSFKPEDVSVKIDTSRAVLKTGASAKKWEQNKPAGSETINANGISFRIPAKGIVAYKIPVQNVKTQLQKKMFAKTFASPGKQSFTETKAAFGKVYAMLISMGPGLTSGYVYTDALPENTITATLRYRQGKDAWLQQTDTIFPYEFSIPFAEGKGNLELDFEVETAEQKIEHAPLIQLSTK